MFHVNKTLAYYQTTIMKIGLSMHDNSYLLVNLFLSFLFFLLIIIIIFFDPQY